jgi:selenium metabolism protein YedF
VVKLFLPQSITKFSTKEHKGIKHLQFFVSSLKPQCTKSIFSFVLLRLIFIFLLMKIVDTKGQLCPAPLIATKRALKESAAGESFTVLTDNLTSFNNVSRFLRDNKTGFHFSEKDGIWSLSVTKGSGEMINPNAEEYCSPEIAHFDKGAFVVVLSSDKMGEGDEELGSLLLGNFIKALKDLDKLPAKILFYNKGVTLAKVDSSLYDHLKDLEKMGVELLLCATCVNHYSLAEKINIGILSNMYVIAEAMTSAEKVIRP